MIQSADDVLLHLLHIKLTHFKPLSHFYISWKCQKTIDFLRLFGGIEMEIGLKWVTNEKIKRAIIITVQYVNNQAC